MPWTKTKIGSSWTVLDENGEPRGSGLSELEAERMVKASYADTDRLMGRRPLGKAGPADSLNVPYQYGGGE